MKKRLAMVLALSMVSVSLLAGCGKQESGADEKKDDKKTESKAYEEKKAGDTFTVGFDQDFPPMGFVGDDGEYRGFDLELAQEVRDWNWNLCQSRLHGIPRMRSLNPAELIVSGTVSL